MSDVISDTEINNVAASAKFTFDVDLHDGGDTYFVSGDGTDDLDRLVLLIQHNPRATLRLDTVPLDTSFKEAGLADVLRLRDAFLMYFTGTNTGDLAKPDEFQDPHGAAAQLSS